MWLLIAQPGVGSLHPIRFPRFLKSSAGNISHYVSISSTTLTRTSCTKLLAGSPNSAAILPNHRRARLALERLLELRQIRYNSIRTIFSGGMWVDGRPQ